MTYLLHFRYIHSRPNLEDDDDDEDHGGEGADDDADDQGHGGGHAPLRLHHGRLLRLGVLLGHTPLLTETLLRAPLGVVAKGHWPVVGRCVRTGSALGLGGFDIEYNVI